MSAPIHTPALLVHRQAPEPVVITDLGTKLHEFHNACGVLSVVHAYNRAVAQPVPLDAWSIQQMLVMARIYMEYDGTLYTHGTKADDTVLQRCADMLHVDISLYCMNLTDMAEVYELTGVRKFSANNAGGGAVRAHLTLGHYMEHYVVLRDGEGSRFLAQPPRQIQYRPDLRIGSPVWVRVMESLRDIRQQRVPAVAQMLASRMSISPDPWGRLKESERQQILDAETVHHYEAAITDPRNAYCSEAQHQLLLVEARRVAERVVRARYAASC